MRRGGAGFDSTQGRGQDSRQRGRTIAMAQRRTLDRFRSLRACLLRVALLVWITTGWQSFSAHQSPPAGIRDMNALKTRGGLAALPSPVWVQKRSIPVDVHF